MARTFIGIDPGLDGAVCVIQDDGAEKLHVGLFDTPTLNVGRGKVTKRDYAIPGMVALLEPAGGGRFGGRCSVALEAVHSMPGQGVASTFTFGKGFGVWLGILGALGLPYDLVPPQRWKASLMNGMGLDKDASRLRALQLYPQLADELKRKKDNGRADALLLAEYLRRQYGLGGPQEGE